MKRLFSLFAFCLLVVMTYAFGIAGPPGSRIVTNPPNAKYEGVYQILRNRASVSGIPFNQAILSDRKCGLKMMEMIHRLRPTMTAEERSEIDRALATNGYQKDRVIGHFDIFYDTTGDNEPFLIDSSNVPISGTAEQYIDSVGYYFNMAWSVEVDSFGYPAPPFQRAMSHYVIQVINFHATDYGQTLWGDTDEIGSFNPPKFATHIQVDCSYQDPIFYSRGIAGLKVTTAHEFQHSIQIGNYGYWYGENYFYEICAVWMETMVHPEVPDYLQYLSDSFGNPLGEFQTPDQTFVLGNGLIEYSRVVWAKYLRKRWSRDLMLHVWQNIPSYHTVQAMDHALGGVSSSFSQAFIEWGDWNYHTGSRSDTVKYYSEGNLFPEIALRPVLDYVSPSGFVIDSIEAISCAYQPVHYSTDFLERVTNLDINAPSPESTEGYTLQIDGSGGSGYTRLQNGLYVSLQVAHPENWSVVSTVPQSVTDAIAYPDPFFSSKSGALNFLFPQTSAVTATLQVMTQNMELVYKNSLPVNSNLGQSFVSWDAKNFHGDRLAAGIYIYSINAGGILYNGKFAVIR